MRHSAHPALASLGAALALAAALALCASPAHAQRRDSTKVDSAARARRDSAIIARELQRIRNEPRVRTDSTPDAASKSAKAVKPAKAVKDDPCGDASVRPKRHRAKKPKSPSDSVKKPG